MFFVERLLRRERVLAYMKQTTSLYCNNILGLFGWWLEGFSSPLSVCDWTVPYTCICSQIKLILSDEGYTVYKVIAMSTFITKTPECGLLFEKKKKIAHKYKCLCVITVCKAELYRKNKMVWSRKLRINHPLSLHSSSTIYPPSTSVSLLFSPIFISLSAQHVMIGSCSLHKLN